MDFLFRLLTLFILFLDKLFQPLYWLISRRKVKKLPKINNEILLFSATKLAQCIRTKQLSSEEILLAYIERIKEVNPIINAIAEERFTEALQEARLIDKKINENKIESNEWREKPFLGVPITVKESCGLKGVTQCIGSLQLLGNKCQRESEVVRNVKKSGFIPILASSCPEYSVGVETINLVNGITRNPYNSHFSAGGSSGGEGALIASCASIVGIGSDYAGSIRIPCLFNGIFGHKPTPKTVSSVGHYPVSEDKSAYDYFSIGPMTRYIIDLKPLFKAMLDEHVIETLQLNNQVNLTSIKIYYSPIYNNMTCLPSVDKEIQTGIEQAITYLHKNYNMSVNEVQFDGFEDAMEISTCIFLNVKSGINFLKDHNNPKRNLSLYMEMVKSIFNQSKLTIFLLVFLYVQRRNGFIRRSLCNYYYKQMKKLQNSVVECLGTDGVLILPTYTSSAFQHYQTFFKSTALSHVMIFSLLGCPATQIPIGLNNNKMPIGFQVIAAPYQDRLCLAVGEELEKHFGGWIPPNTL